MKNLLCATLSTGFIVLIILFSLLLIAGILFFVFIPCKVWFRSIIEKAYVSPFKLYSLKARDLPFDMLINWYTICKKEDLDFSFDDLIVFYNSGGNLQNLINGLIFAKESGVCLSIDSAKALDKSQNNISEVIKFCINPISLKSGKFSIFTFDNVELSVEMTFSLRANLNKFIGGLDSQIIISRAKEIAILTFSGFDDYKEALKNCDIISSNILAKKIDKDCKYDLISVEVTSCEMVRDLEYEKSLNEKEHLAKLSVIKAEEEKHKEETKLVQSQNKLEQEKIKKVENDIEMTKSIVKSFEEGKFDILDYCKVQNLIADTNMRNSIISSLKDDGKDSKSKKK